MFLRQVLCQRRVILDGEMLTANEEGNRRPSTDRKHLLHCPSISVPPVVGGNCGGSAYSSSLHVVVSFCSAAICVVLNNAEALSQFECDTQRRSLESGYQQSSLGMNDIDR